jgi:hypothetical protein
MVLQYNNNNAVKRGGFGQGRTSTKSKKRCQGFLFGRLLFWSAHDRHHPIRKVKTRKGNMMIVRTLFRFDTSISSINFLLSKLIIRFFEKHTSPICQLQFAETVFALGFNKSWINSNPQYVHQLK